jgi:hypothetical protein
MTWQKKKAKGGIDRVDSETEIGAEKKEADRKSKDGGNGYLLTSSSNNSTASSSLRTSATQRQDEAQPAKRHLLAAAVKVRHQSAGGLELAQLTGVRWVADGEDRLEPARAGGDGAAVNPDIEAGAATVGTVATLADTAEGQGGDVQSGVIDGDTTGAGRVNNLR